ncbi:unnamed protein product, partial [Allacma fusca]
QTNTDEQQNVILTAASAALEKLNKYYRSSDAMVYVMGRILDPRCQRYKNVQIKPSVIKCNKRTAFKVWEDKYKPKDEVDENSTNANSLDLVAQQMNLRKSTQTDEFKMYLSNPVIDVGAAENVLIWWKWYWVTDGTNVIVCNVFTYSKKAPFKC